MTPEAPDSKEVLDRIFTAIPELADRMVLGTAVFVILTMQIFIASEVLDDQTARELTELLDFGVVTLGVFEIVGYLILFWMLRPILVFFSSLLRDIVTEVRA